MPTMTLIKAGTALEEGPETRWNPQGTQSDRPWEQPETLAPLADAGYDEDDDDDDYAYGDDYDDDEEEIFDEFEEGDEEDEPEAEESDEEDL